MHVERTVTIDQPIEEVFEYVSTPEIDPTWGPAGLSHERTSPGPMRVGMTTQMDLKFLGRTGTYTWEVVEYEAPKLLAYRATSGPLPIDVRLQFEPVDGGTRFTHAIDTEPRGFYYQALASLMPGAIERILESMLGNLKNQLEGKPATPSRGPAAAPSAAITGGIVVAAVAVIALLLWGRRSRSSRR
jgi:uncharacterized protein YndB with AHSA1/START domain